MKVEFHVSIRVAKPVAEVFDAVVSPKKLSGYFVESSSAPLQAGEQVVWKFADFPDKVPVTVRKVVPNEKIELEWPSEEGGYNTTVEMSFKPINPNTTLISIAESGWKQTEKGIKSSYGNCGGWMHMLCCMKAYLEHGINLRAGSYMPEDFQ